MSLYKASDDGHITNFDILVITAIGIVFLPFSILTIALILYLRHKRTRRVAPAFITLFCIIVISLFDNSIMHTFFNDYWHTISQIIKSIEIRDFYSIPIILLTMPLYFSLKGLLLPSCLSIVIAFMTADWINQRVKTIQPLEKDMEDIERGYRTKRKVKPIIAQQNISGATIIGMSGQKLITTQDDAKHIFVSGTTGSGKTVALSNYIESAAQKGYAMALIDGKGDTGKGSMLDIVQHFCKHRKIYVINLNDPERSEKYNPFINANATVCKDMIVNMTEWSEEHYKSNAERYIQRVAQLLIKSGEKLSFKGIIEHIPIKNLTALSSKLSANNTISKEQHLETVKICETSGKIAENAAARFSTIAESELGQIFDEDGIDIYTAIKENAIILFILNPLIYPEVSQLVGRLILIDCKKAVSQLYLDRPERTFFIFDEINVYASPTLIDLVNKSRSANVTCILATQSLADLEYAHSDAFKQQVIENCNNFIVMRQNSFKSAEEWAKVLGTRQGIEITHQLGSDGVLSSPTGYGTAKRVRQFYYHPDEIKELKTGQAIYLSKDTATHAKITVRKGF